MNHHTSHLQPDGSTFPPVTPDPPPPPGYVDPLEELEDDLSQRRPSADRSDDEVVQGAEAGADAEREA